MKIDLVLALGLVVSEAFSVTPLRPDAIHSTVWGLPWRFAMHAVYH